MNNNLSNKNTKTIPTNLGQLGYENFESNNDGVYDVSMETNKLFCFNGTFTILTVFILVLLLIFININSKK